MFRKYSSSSSKRVLTTTIPRTRSCSYLVSPVPEFLKSNILPSDHESDLIYGAIKNAEDELSTLISENSASNSAELERLVEEHTTFIHSHRMVLSSIRRIPQEILEEIFLAYREEVADELPFILTHICQLWRDIGLKTPALWSKIPSIKLTKRGKKKDFVSFMDEILRRSSDVPLHLHIRASAGSDDSRHNHPVLESLISHSHRWKSIQLEFPATLVASLTPKISGRLPLLKILDLHILQADYYPATMQLGAFEFAPELREVSISWGMESIFATRLKLPWSQLTHFTEKSLRPVTGGADRAIELASELTEITYSIITPNHDEFYTPPDITLEKLRGFRISSDDCWRPHRIHAILEKLTVPNLEELVISSFYQPPERIASFLVRSSCNLKVLSLHTLDGLDNDALASILFLTPLLTELDVSHQLGLNLEILVVDPGRQPLIPCLEKLVIRDREHKLSAPLDKILSSRRESIAVKDLQIIRLVFRFKHDRGSALLLLNRWYQLSDKEKEGRHIAQEWKLILQREIDRNKQFPGLLKARERIFKSEEEAQKLDNAFKNIENDSAVSSYWIYSTGLHVIMQGISSSTGAKFAGDDKFKFRERAQSILEKWTPMLREDMRSWKWLLDGESSLQCIPHYSEEWNTVNRTDMLFGVEQFRSKFELVWQPAKSSPVMYISKAL